MNSAHSIAEKLDALITAAGNPSYASLARDMASEGNVSAAYLWQLRTGARDNPTFHHLQTISSYFSRRLDLPVGLSYFDPQTPVDQPWRDAGAGEQTDVPEREQQDLADRLADLGVRQISARYGRQGADVLRDVLAVMDRLNAQQQPGPDADPAAPAPG